MPPAADSLGEIWVYLSQTPLLWLTATLLVYQGSFMLQRAVGSPLLNPVLVSVVLLVGTLTLTGTPYQSYFDGAQFVHFLLGPATVALAIPLYNQLDKLRSRLLPLLVTLLSGATVAVVLAVLIGRLSSLSEQTLLSLAPKSITTPIAMGVSEGVGGLASLTAVLVILTGIVGAVSAKGLFAPLGIKDESAQGFAIGLASHGVGTARAFDTNEEAGAFSGLAMGLNGAATAILVPWLIKLFGF